MSEKFLFGVIAILLTSITGLGAAQALQHPEEAAAIVPTAIDTVETAIVNATNTVARTVSRTLAPQTAPTVDDRSAGSDSSREHEDEDEDEDEDGDDRGSRSTAGTANATQSAATPAPTPAPASSQGSAGTFTMQQIAAHASAASCYSAIEGSVYDLTSFVSKHPGGSGAIKSLCGVDGTAAFMAQHGGSGSPARTLASFKIGVVVQ